MLVGYSAMLIAAVILFLMIRAYGETQFSTASADTVSKRAAPEERPDTLLHVLFALLVIIGVSQGLGWIFRGLGQPRVIGEVVGGILLGPSFLGRISPAAQNFVLPEAVAPFLNILAQLGVILYMFLVGLELNAGRLHGKAHAAVAISHTSITLPFLLG